MNTLMNNRTVMCAVLLLCVGVSRSLSAQTASQPADGWFGAETWTTPAGAVVLTVDPAAPAHQAGLVAGDTILSADGQAIQARFGWSKLRQHLTPGGRVTLRVTHGAVRTVTVVGIPRRPTILPAVGDSAPQLNVFRWLNTTQTLLSRTTFGDGHIYVLDFTANWCTMCPGMYPPLDTLAQQYAARGLRVVYVTGLLWEPYDPTDQTAQEIALGTVQQYIDIERMHHPVAVLASAGTVAYSGYFSRLALEDKGADGYDVGLPHLVIIDGAGTVRALPHDVPELRQAVAAVMDTVPHAHATPPASPATHQRTELPAAQCQTLIGTTGFRCYASPSGWILAKTPAHAELATRDIATVNANFERYFAHPAPRFAAVADTDLVSADVMSRLRALGAQGAIPWPVDPGLERLGVMNHELGHIYYNTTFPGQGMPWLKEVAAILMERAASTHTRYCTLAGMLRSPERDQLLLPLATLFTMAHPSHADVKNDQTLGVQGSIQISGSLGPSSTMPTAGDSAGAPEPPCAPDPPGGHYSTSKVFYEECRSVIDFLIAQSQDSAIFRAITDDAAKGARMEAWLQRDGARYHLPASVDALERAWRSWLVPAVEARLGLSSDSIPLLGPTPGAPGGVVTRETTTATTTATATAMTVARGPSLSLPPLSPWCDSLTAPVLPSPGSRLVRVVACGTTPAESLALHYGLTAVATALPLYGHLTGIPYPWSRYTMTVNPGQSERGGLAGGLGVPQGAFFDVPFPDARAALDRPALSAKVIVHELAHHWGSHRGAGAGWLTEGWADFMAGQVWRATGGPRAEEEFLFFYNTTWDDNWTAAPVLQAVPGGPVGAPTEWFSLPWPGAQLWAQPMDREQAYYRGAVVLWMLQQYLGEAHFWAATHAYLADTTRGDATTAFLRAIQTVTGEDLGWFFQEWVHGPGYPRFTIAARYDAAAHRVTLQVQQAAPVFRMPVTVRVGTSAGDILAHATVDAATQTLVVDHVLHTPTSVVFDDGDAIVKTLDFPQPTAWLVTQLRREAHPWQTWWAVEQLRARADHDPAAVAALVSAARTGRYALTRTHALIAVGTLGTRDAGEKSAGSAGSTGSTGSTGPTTSAAPTTATVLAAMTAAAHDTAVLVRRAVVQGLAVLGTPAAWAVERALFAQDPSAQVRADAVHNLLMSPATSATDRQALVAQALGGPPTYQDLVPLAAVQALSLAGHCDTATVETFRAALHQPGGTATLQRVTAMVVSMFGAASGVDPTCAQTFAAQLPLPGASP